MRRIRILFFFVLLVPFFGFTQDIILPNISLPGGVSVGAINGAVLGENLIGPRKILFSANKLQKEEVGKKISGFGVATTNVDQLSTLYSGKIFSPGVDNVFVFENKTSEELSLLEVTLFPKILELPYTLFIDLVIRTTSKPISANPLEKSDDAGKYAAKILISLMEI